MLRAQTNPVPFINQPLVPETVPPGSGGFTLTVHGANFAPTATVKWNALVRQTVVVSDTLLQATIKASDVASARTASVTVVNVDARNETSNVAYLTVRKPAPAVAVIATPNFSATGVVTDGDFNNDGKLDVVVCNVNGTTLVVDVYLNQGNLKFGSHIESVFKFTGNKPLRIASPLFVGDFNNDHKLDLELLYTRHPAGAPLQGWGLASLLGDGKGKFTLGPSTLFFGDVDTATPAGDLNGDGNLDFITTFFQPEAGVSEVDGWFGNGDGSFTCSAPLQTRHMGPCLK